MRTERVDGKGVKVVKQGNIFDEKSAASTTEEPQRENVRDVQPEALTQLQPPTRVTSSNMVSSSVTWRKRKSSQTNIVHYAEYDLHQVGYELALGFQRYSDMAYRIFTDNQTWRGERQYHLIENEPDVALMQDTIDMADVIILSYDHSAGFLHRQNMEGKKLIIYHQGDPFIRECGELGMLETKAGYGRLASTPNLLEYVEPDSTPLTWLPHPINTAEMDLLAGYWEKPVDEPLRILHSLTILPGAPMPDFVRIVHQMKRDGENVCIGLVQPVNRQVSLWTLSQADVYFSTYTHGPGPLTVEAMALGVPALAGCKEDHLEHQLKAAKVKRVDDLPWIYVTPDTTEKRLRELQDPDTRAHWAEKGRKFVERFHSVPSVVKRLERFCERLEPAKGVIYSAGEVFRDEVIWKRKLRMFDDGRIEK